KPRPGGDTRPPAAAQPYSQRNPPGAPAPIPGRPRPGLWDNGWTMWFLPWTTYLHGSALGQAVAATPAGSTFISPWQTAITPPWTSPATTTAPLGAPNPRNSPASYTQHPAITAPPCRLAPAPSDSL